MAQENTHHRMGQLYNYIVEKKLAEKAVELPPVRELRRVEQAPVA